MAMRLLSIILAYHLPYLLRSLKTVLDNIKFMGRIMSNKMNFFDTILRIPSKYP